MTRTRFVLSVAAMLLLGMTVTWYVTMMAERLAARVPHADFVRYQKSMNDVHVALAMQTAVLGGILRENREVLDTIAVRQRVNERHIDTLAVRQQRMLCTLYGDTLRGCMLPRR